MSIEQCHSSVENLRTVIIDVTVMCLQLQQWAESKRGPGSLPPTVKLRMPKPLVPAAAPQTTTDEVMFSSVNDT